MRKATIGILVLLAVLAIPTASAHVTLYIVPQDSCVPQGYCNTTYIEVWANVTGSDTFRGGQFAITTDGTCVDIIDNSWGPKIHPPGSRWKHEGSGHPCGGYECDWIIFEWYDGPPTYNGYLTAPANEMLCNLTVHCNCSSCDYCTSGMNITCGVPGCLECPIQVLDKDINNLYPDDATLINGTIECGINVDKTVYNPASGKWEDSISGVEKDTELRFRINVSAGPCYNYTSVVVNDTLPAFLTYNDNAIPFEPTPVGGNKYQWILGPLNNSETKTIEFNATASDSGSGDNEVAVTMDCVECGGAECSGADAVPVHVKPAGICGDCDQYPGVTTNDGWLIYMNLTFPGDSRYAFTNAQAADCDIYSGVTTNDGWLIYMNLTFPGNSDYVLRCD